MPLGILLTDCGGLASRVPGHRLDQPHPGPAGKRQRSRRNAEYTGEPLDLPYLSRRGSGFGESADPLPREVAIPSQDGCCTVLREKATRWGFGARQVPAVSFITGQGGPKPIAGAAAMASPLGNLNMPRG